MPTDSDFSSYPENKVNVVGSTEEDRSFGFLAAYGRRFQSGLGFEIEAARRRVKTETITHKATNAFKAEGPIPVSIDTTVITAIGNAVYTAQGLLDFAEPFLGAGVGVMWAKRNAFQYPAHPTATAPAGLDGLGKAGLTYDISQPDESVGAIVWQVMAGVHIPLDDALSARLSYRYLRSGKVDYGDVETKFGAHTLEAGLAWSF